MRLLFLFFLVVLSACKVRKVKDVTKIDSVAHVARNESTAVNMVLLDTSQIVTENKTYIEVLNDSGKVVQRIFSYEIKHEKKAIKQEVKTLTDISEKTSVKVSKVAKKKDKDTMSYWGLVLVLVAVGWIWFTLRKGK
jgi:viroplasmin and RNaseH domain-containing protein